MTAVAANTIRESIRQGTLGRGECRANGRGYGSGIRRRVNPGNPAEEGHRFCRYEKSILIHRHRHLRSIRSVDIMRNTTLAVAASTAILLSNASSAADHPAAKEGDLIAREFKFHTGEVMPEVAPLPAPNTTHANCESCSRLPPTAPRRSAAGPRC